MAIEFDPATDMIDLRDVVDRYDELIEYEEDGDEADADELAAIRSFVADVVSAAIWQPKGTVVDEFRDLADNEPTVIADHYFVEYAKDLAEDIGAIKSVISWPAHCIDWERAAQELQMDYTAFEHDGRTYWRRAY